jgi:flagellar protein FlbD
MIELSKLNGSAILVNPDLIRFIEATPDTVLTFTDGEKLMVREEPQAIKDLIVRFRRTCTGLALIKE